jgi:YHS domain-containing protein/thioredoxin-related protein
MIRSRWILPIVVLGVFFSHAAFGQQPIHWEATIDSAKSAASQSHRLVLVFFCAGYCAPCHRMESELRNQPGAVTALEANYVPVKISSEYYPNTAKQFGVTRIPTTVIIAPNAQGTVLASFAEYMPVDQYLSKLNKVAADAKHQDSAAFAQISASPQVGAPAGSGLPLTVGQAPSGTSPGAAFPNSDSTAAAGSGTQAGAGIGPLATPPVSAPGLESQKPAENIKPRASPLLGLDGFCPVQLVDNSRWEPGKRAWGAIHRGRTYLFAGMEERTRFLANPDRYAPVNSGDDVVLSLDQGQSVPGHREHGVQFEGHVYLFASEATLDKFQSNRHYYADRALQAIRSTAQASAGH